MTATKASAKKAGKKKTTKKASSRSGATRKKATKKTARKKTARKKAAKKTTARKKATARKSSTRKKASKKKTTRRTAPPSMPPKGAARTGIAHTLNGIEVVTPDGRAPGKKGAQGYVEGVRIKKLKFIQALRAGGIGEIADLQRSIRAHGIIEPLVVRPAGNGKDFELIAGERRLTALKALGGPKWNNIPVIVRTDLQGDDDKAAAAAIAENSPDGRSNLNVVDIGEQCLRFKKKKWSTDRMSKEMGLHVKKVRRALEIMEVPETLQKRLREGTVTANVALEVKRVDPELRDKIAAEVGPGTVAGDVRRIRKRLEREEAAAKAEKAEKGEKQGKKTKKTGEESTAPKLGTWQKPSEKTLQIGSMCSAFIGADESEVGSTGWHELRGSIGYALWDRGDLKDPILPSIFEDEMSDKAAGKKLNAVFDGIVANEAARYDKRAAAATS